MELQGQLTESYQVFLGGALLSPILAVVLMVMLLSGSVREWAQKVRSGGVTEKAPHAEAELCTTALLSLCFSLVPFILCQLAALVLGIVALVQISRSGGRLRGTGMAIAGLVISSLLIMLLVGILLFIFVFIPYYG
jgi:hypothetical protein